MKKKLIAFTLIGFAFLISGCGGSNSQKTNVNIKNRINMEINTSYIIEKGDEIKKVSNAEIELSSDFKNKKTVAILHNGEAILIKK